MSCARYAITMNKRDFMNCAASGVFRKNLAERAQINLFRMFDPRRPSRWTVVKFKLLEFFESARDVIFKFAAELTFGDFLCCILLFWGGNSFFLIGLEFFDMFVKFIIY
jgi:hypothetical protein